MLTEEEIFAVAIKIKNEIERDTYLKKYLGNDTDNWHEKWQQYVKIQGENS